MTPSPEDVKHLLQSYTCKCISEQVQRKIFRTLKLYFTLTLKQYTIHKERYFEHQHNISHTPKTDRPETDHKQTTNRPETDQKQIIKPKRVRPKTRNRPETELTQHL
ncbi:hypothetical protein YC2023_118189 [Brassica napus]